VLALLLVLVSLNSFSQNNLALANSSELIQEGIKLHDAGKYREAIEVFERITSADSNYVLALYEKALSSQSDSMFEQGMKYCKEALKLTYDREREPELYTLYGNLADNLNQYDRALRIYDSAIAMYPAYSSLYVNKTITLINQKQYDKAENVLKQALLQDPYSPSLHYYYGMVSINKGRIVPAILSYCTYLLILPEGMNRGKVINILSSIANNEDAVVDLINKRTEETPANFQEIEQLLSSKIALDKGYKKLVDLDDPICRQLQVVMEKLAYDENETDFSMQYYVPVYQKIFADKQFEPFINYIFSALDLNEIKAYNKRNKKELQQFTNNVVAYYNTVRATRKLKATQRDEVTERYHFEDGKLYGFGLVNGDLNVGEWKYYFTSGNLKSIGKYDDRGKRQGLWKFYYFNGKYEGEENFVNGVLEGPVMYNYTNGKLSLKGFYKDGKQQGEFTKYFKTGGVNYIEMYEGGLANGIRRSFFPSGVANSVENYKDGKMNGPFVVYHSNGKKEKEGQIVEDRISGPYVNYFDNGMKAIEGRYENGLSVGPWKQYHRNGNLKLEENFVNDLSEGEYKEYYDNGELFTRFTNKKGKINGEASYMDRDGKLFSILFFDNDKIKWAKYFDKTGKQISFSETKNKSLNLVAFTPQGQKKSESFYNEKGDLEGNRNFYYSSGTLKETYTYRSGKAEGISVAYFPNKSKKHELTYQDGNKDGFLTTYYSHGKKEQEGWYVNDKAQGTWLEYDIQSRLTKRSEYLDDKLHGTVTSYWPNGKKEMESHYDNGDLTGIIQYDTSGNIINNADVSDGTCKLILLNVNRSKQLEGSYVNNEPVGEWKQYFFDGKIKSLKYYKDGLLDSIYREYYYNGKLSIEGKYYLGNKTGEWNYYSKTGKLSTKEEFADGELTGKKYNYYENGKVQTEAGYQYGDRNGLFKRFDEDGLLMVQTNYKDGIFISYSYNDKNNNPVPEIAMNNGNGKVTAYYPNGKKSLEYEIVDDELNNSDNRYYSNGQINMESREDYGNTEDYVKYYYPDGKLKSSTKYLHNVMEGPYKEFYPNGAIKTEGQYVNGMVHGMVKSYDEKGKLTETQTFYFDQLLGVRK